MGKFVIELVKLYYQNGMNATEVLGVYHRNHLQNRGSYTPQDLCDLIKKFEDKGYTCGKPRFGLPTVSEGVVTEVCHTGHMHSWHMQTSRGTAHVLDTSKTTALKILGLVLRMFPYRYQHVHKLQA